MRVNGKWGTVSNKGASKTVAKFMCKSLNYLFGEILINDGGESFCSNFND